MNSRRRKTLISTSLLVALAAIAIWRWRSQSEVLRYPDAPESATVWLCSACPETRNLTARETYQWLKDPQRSRAASNSGLGASAPRLLCEKCGTFTLERARHCAQHDKWYGSAGCPLCPADD